MEDAVEARRAIEQVNAKLRVSEEQYRMLFTSIDEGFCVIELLFDAQGTPVDYRFLETNPAFEKQTGLDELIGKRVRELLPHHDAHWFEKYGQVALTGESVRFVSQAHDLGGRWFDVDAFRLGAPERRQVAVLFTDITERIRMEETTNEYAKSLADSNRRKDEFLAMLSHELRNPLAAIMNATRLLKLQRDRNPVQIEAHGMIDRQVAHLARLVDDLLEVSRISTGRIRLQMERVDFRGIVHHAMETTQPQASQKGHSMTSSLPEGPLWVNGDHVRLEQIVVNLINNAVKYTDRGGDLSVTLTQQGDEAVLAVRDNGVGISPEMLPRIFDLFTQADTSLDRAQGGLGIGLALVQSLVTLHRGRVEAESTLGEGSEFIVTLPVLLSLQVSMGNTADDAPAAAHEVRVLVVDDNADARESLAMLLQAMGHDTRLAQDGASALQAALDYRPDVVLLDIGLPVVDGFQVAQWMRQEPVLQDVVLVALTGYGQESDRQRSREAGFNHHLVKPVDFAKVESILVAAATRAR
jgi:PAS domain S-box-containing protein